MSNDAYRSPPAAPHYKLVYASEDFEKQVNELSKEGYEPCGSIGTVINRFYLLMVRR